MLRFKSTDLLWEIERNEILFKTTAVNMTRNTGMTYPVYAK
jgi:hypothetical protein